MMNRSLIGLIMISAGIESGAIICPLYQPIQSAVIIIPIEIIAAINTIAINNGIRLLTRARDAKTHPVQAPPKQI